MALEDIKGVGNARRQILNSLGMETVGDVLNRLPVDYLRASREDDRPFEDGSFAALIGSFPQAPKRGFSKGGARYATAVFVTGGRTLTAVWFHADYILRSVKAGTPYMITGRLKVEGRRVTILQPICDADVSEEIVPVYRLSNKLSQKIFRRIVHGALSRFPARSMIPEQLAERRNLTDLQESFCRLHVPCRLLRETSEDGCESSELTDSALAALLTEARERVELERFYGLLMSFRIARSGNSARRVNRYRLDREQLKRFALNFPFELTESQKRTVNEIFSDLSGEFPMNRLLQGDVGSGKTAVAACALFLALQSGFQGAIVAPTEVLARQHFEELSGLFAPFGGEAVLLTSSVTGRARSSALAKIADGRAKIVVGTHSILQSAVEYDRLALVVIDEQHKFGVSERAKLVEKGENCDVLVMSATPIPRTLSLLFYNDLDVSILREKPANRGQVSNFIVRKSKRENMFRYFGERAREGEKIYVVCPSVENEQDADSESDKEGGSEAVKSLAAELSRTLPDLEIGCLYGTLKENDKQGIVSAFRDGSISILVTTTVIEVGVNVPSANYMAIMNAERFGLAQLHQLRGRIGRGSRDGFCYFYTESDGEKGLERLEFLKRTNDGFEISEKDFELRGPGDYFGESQSGFDKTLLKMDLSLYQTAKELAEETEPDEKFIENYRRICREKNLEFPSVVLN